MALLLLRTVVGAQPALSVTAISAGEEHSLALASDGSVWEWGASLPGRPNDVAISGGLDYSLAVRGDGGCGRHLPHNGG